MKRLCLLLLAACFGANAGIVLGSDCCASTNGEFGVSANLTISSGPNDSFFVQRDVFISLARTITTTGPVRSGLVLLQLSVLAFINGAGSDTALSSAQFGPYQASESWTPHVLLCSPELAADCPQTYLLPIILGAPLEVTTLGSIHFSGFVGDGATVLGIANSDVHFTLYEADGVTPVPYTLDPEPKPVLLLAAGAVLLALRQNRPSRFPVI